MKNQNQETQYANTKALNDVLRNLIRGVNEHIKQYGNPYDFEKIIKEMRR